MTGYYVSLFIGSWLSMVKSGGKKKPPAGADGFGIKCCCD